MTAKSQVAGLDARRRTRDVQQRLGVMLQSTALHDKITPREALQLFATFYRNAADPEQLLDRFSLTDKSDARFETLSGGQRQRLALAIAFVNRPEFSASTSRPPDSTRSRAANCARKSRVSRKTAIRCC
jgi:ABC-2 type transport system ATP-binding protein